MKNWPLYPFAILYGLGMSFRNVLFNLGILKSQKYPFPVIGIGNLTTGGTGKSPHSIKLVEILKEDFKIAVISRGYGRKTAGYKVANYESSYEEIGDEPLQMFERFRNKIVVAVGENRVETIDKVVAKFGVNLVVLDDIFQHRYVKPGLVILLTEYHNLYVNDHLLPVGNLREFKKGAKRADVVIVTKCPKEVTDQDKKKVQNQLSLHPKQNLYFSNISYYKNAVNRNEEIPIDALEDYEIVLVTGIANPSDLVDYISKKAKKVHHLAFKDHHHFSDKDIEAIEEKHQAIKGEKIILTTEKDYMRLKSYAHMKEKLFFLPISIEIDQETEFRKLIQQYAHKN